MSPICSIRLQRHRRRRAFTMVEVIIASAILAITVLAAITAMFAASRMARDARYDMMAMEALNRQVEVLRTSEYEYLGNTSNVNYHPYNFVAAALDDNDTSDDAADREAWEDGFAYDPGHPDNAPIFTYNYEWYGFGVATGGSGNTLVIDATNWPDDVFANVSDFVGSYVTSPVYQDEESEVDNPGGGQIARIQSASTTGVGAGRQITFNLDMQVTPDFTQVTALSPPFQAGTYYQMDGGKWCRVSVEWQPPWSEDPADRQRRIRDIFIADPDPSGLNAEEVSGS